MEINSLYYVYGLCTMFYAMMAYFFVRKADRLSRLLALLMCTLALQCLSANFFMLKGQYADGYWWNMQSSLDMIAVPMYSFILVELVEPGRLKIRDMLLMEAPFLVLPALFIPTGNDIFYYILTAWAVVYGNFFMIWTLVQIPRYHRRLREHFSYTENINLNWLRTILVSFYVLLTLWVVNCVAIHLNVEILYMLLSLGIWTTICYYLYKHEQVMDELRTDVETPAETPAQALSELGRKIEQLFRESKIFLNPHLKLSDVAEACNTNRTYVSNYFNQEAGASFYEYVNTMRVDHACALLRDTNDSVKVIAARSGFNSPQSFIRTFVKVRGVKPTDFRNSL